MTMIAPSLIKSSLEILRCAQVVCGGLLFHISSCWYVRPLVLDNWCFLTHPLIQKTNKQKPETPRIKACRVFPTVLTWSLRSSFFLLSVLSVPYVVWQDVLRQLWLETLFHKCSQNHEPSVKPPLLADNKNQFLRNAQTQ